MRIAQSDLMMTASSSAVSYQSRSVAVRVDVRPAAAPPAQDPTDTVEISSSRPDLDEEDRVLLQTDPALYALAKLIEKITGQKVHLIDPSEFDPHGRRAHGRPHGSPSDARPAASRPQVSVQLDADSIRYEAQSSTFAAAGSVTTADGRQIAFALQATVSREFFSRESLSIRAGDTASKDPLVLDLTGAPTQLSPQKLSFDVNADGVVESVSLPSAGSALLALDRNGNGVVDDGSELFGPQTGSGYGELSALDADGNGWIDESDAAYSQLRLWQPYTGDGQTLQTLQEANVGAISLQNTATPFSFRDPSTNAELGTLRNTGVFLREDGTAGTVRQIDVAA